MEKMEGLAYQTKRKIQNIKDCIEAKEDLKEIEKKYMKKENEDFLEYLTDNFIFMLAKFVEAKWRE